MSNLEELIDAAKAEHWDAVDKNIAVLANNEEVIAWALDKGLEDTENNVRDLAASVLEKSSVSLPESTKAMLLHLVAWDENIYVQFRSAFALYVRGERSPAVIAKMQEAEQDPGVADIARKYLSGK